MGVREKEGSRAMLKPVGWWRRRSSHRLGEYEEFVLLHIELGVSVRPSSSLAYQIFRTGSLMKYVNGHS